MKLVALDDKLHDYNLHVLEAYTRGGIPPQELALAAALYQRLTEARDISIEQLMAQAKVTELGPNGVALEVDLPHDPEPR